MMSVTCFSQRDPRWSSERLGTGTQTIGWAGCLISAVASVLVDVIGVPTDPHRLNEWLKSHGGYANGNLFVWQSVEGLGADLVLRVNCELEPAPVDVLMAYLDSDKFGVVAKVDYNPGGTVQQHWVRLISLASSGGWVVDPWQEPGSEMVGVHDYLLPGWDCGRGIFAAAVYARASGERFDAVDQVGEYQDRLALRG